MNVILKRICGGCTACCKAYKVFALNKPIGKWCPHCQPSQGCIIYPDRPSECKGFKCEWLKGFGTDQERPDRTNVVIERRIVTFKGKTIFEIVHITEATRGAFRSDYVKKLLLLLKKKEIPVLLIHLSGKAKLIADDKFASNKGIKEVIDRLCIKVNDR